jgi:SHS2 domain-containing protein
MARSWEILDHTADVGLAAAGDTLGELFEAMSEGLLELILPERRVNPSQTREIRVEAEDPESLLVDYLGRLCYAVESEYFAVADVQVRRASETFVEAELRGESLDPQRHEIGLEIKAVTYHRLEVAHRDGRWHGRVIFDI